jgi:hypothetical protein
MRLLACEVADFERYHETLPLADLETRIKEANGDPAGGN